MNLMTCPPSQGRRLLITAVTMVIYCPSAFWTFLSVQGN